MPIIVGREVGPIGFGMMGLTWREKPLPVEEGIAALKTALDNGMNFWNGGELYGSAEYNSLVLLERYFAKYPEDADKVTLSIKGGMDESRLVADGSPEGTRRSLNHCIDLLKGRKKIDIFEFARRDQNVPMKTTFDVIEKEYIQTGKVGGISLSEVRAETIHEAAKITKIVSVEVELSLFVRDVFENGIADACAQYGIPLVAYSPIGRGFLGGRYKTIADVEPHTRSWPWFQPGNFEANLELGRQVEALAKQKGVTAAQLAINWARRLTTWRRGAPTIIPIPGASAPARIRENALVVDISDEEMARIDAMAEKIKPKGQRYPDSIPTLT